MDDPNKPQDTYLQVLAVDKQNWLTEIKTHYIATGMTARDIALTTRIPLEEVRAIIKENKLLDLRQAYLRRGISKIQNKQVAQAKKLLDLEYDFKRMRLKQLETILVEYRAYYEKHGDFRKRHPVTKEILRNTNGVALQIDLPMVTREINGLKESVTLSQGLKQLLYQLDDILNTPKPKERVDEDPDDIVDMAMYDAVFKKKE